MTWRAAWRLEERAEHAPSGFAVLLASPPLLIFAGVAVLFHFANAALLPLVGQKLALVNKEVGTSLMAMCIVAAQLVMVPVAMLVGARADVGAASRSFCADLRRSGAARLPYPLSDNPGWSGCNRWTASAPASSARCSRDRRDRHRVPGAGSTSRRAPSRPRRYRSGAIDGGRGCDCGDGGLRDSVRHTGRRGPGRIPGLPVRNAGNPQMACRCPQDGSGRRRARLIDMDQMRLATSSSITSVAPPPMACTRASRDMRSMAHSRM